MSKKIFCLFLFTFFVAAFSVTVYSADMPVTSSAGTLTGQPAQDISTPEKHDERFFIEAKGKTGYIDRDKDFRVGSMLHSLGNYSIDACDINADLDNWGAGYEVRAGIDLDKKIAFEGSFEQFFLSEVKKTGHFPLIGAGGNSTVMGFIDGGLGADGNPVFFAGLGFVGTPPGDYTIKYDMSFLSANMLGFYNFYEDDIFFIDIFAGPVYSRFHQKYKVETSAANDFMPGNVFTNTELSEKLVDNFWGGRLGIRGGIGFLKKFTLNSSNAVDCYYRHTDFDGTQNVTNAVPVIFAPPTYNRSAERHLSEKEFSPRLVSDTSLSYELFNNVLITVFYRLDRWWNMTHVKNPEPVLTAGMWGSEPAEIKNENLTTHTFGGSVIVEF